MSNIRMRLEFAPRQRRVGVSAIALVLSVLLLVFAVLQVGMSTAENATQARRLAALGSRPEATAPDRPQPARVDPAEQAGVQLVRQAARSLATPWPDLLAALESAPAAVALLSVEPSAVRRSLALTAEAASPVEMLDYLRALQEDRRLTDVTLVSHQVQVQAPGAPLRFQIRANWRASP